MFSASAGNAFVPTQEALPSPAAVVKPQTFVSIEPVPRGKSFEIAVVAEIAKGFHMNSHKPTDPYLIPTTLTPQLPSGFDVADTIYPDGHQEKFSFSPNKPLNVYTGKVILRLKLTAHPDAALGPTTIPLPGLQRHYLPAACKDSGRCKVSSGCCRHKITRRPCGYFRRRKLAAASPLYRNSTCSNPRPVSIRESVVRAFWSAVFSTPSCNAACCSCRSASSRTSLSRFGSGVEKSPVSRE
jgi:hypothetical protein